MIKKTLNLRNSRNQNVKGNMKRNRNVADWMTMMMMSVATPN